VFSPVRASTKIVQCCKRKWMEVGHILQMLLEILKERNHVSHIGRLLPRAIALQAILQATDS